MISKEELEGEKKQTTTLQHVDNASDLVRNHPLQVRQSINLANLILQEVPRATLVSETKEGAAGLSLLTCASLYEDMIKKLEKDSPELKALEAIYPNSSPPRLKFPKNEIAYATVTPTCGSNSADATVAMAPQQSNISPEELFE